MPTKHRRQYRRIRQADAAQVTEHESGNIASAFSSLRWACIPFRAQHYILKSLQCRLEQCGFAFLQRCSFSEPRSLEWGYPEEMELPKFFQLLQKHFGCLDTKEIMRYKRQITNIRHAAVHRVAQSRHSIWEKLDAASAFAKSLEDFQCVQDILLFKMSLKGLLADLDDCFEQLASRTRAQLYHCKCHPLKLRRRLLLLPQAVKRIVEQNEHRFNSLVQGVVRSYLLGAGWLL